MTHPNRLLHRKNLESGVIDNNPYPQDMKPEVAELGSSIDTLTKPVQNEVASGEPVLGKERKLNFPSFSLHGKTGSMHVDRDGTYRLVNCSVDRLSFETAATVILINSTVAEITGAVEDSGPSGVTNIRFIFVDSKLGNVNGANYFFLSLHGASRWDGGLSGCRHGSVRLLQSIDWVAANNFVDCEDIVFSAAMTQGAAVVPVGGTFAKNCKRFRLHWHATDLRMDSGTMLSGCSDMLMHHHGCSIRAGTNLAGGCTTVGVIMHSSTLNVGIWIFLNTKRPTISAISSTINTGGPATGGIFEGCNAATCHLGNKTQCNTGGLLTGSDGTLSLVKATVSAGSALVDAVNSSVSVKNSTITTSGGTAAIVMKDSQMTLDNLHVTSGTVAYNLTNSTAEIRGGSADGAAGGLKLKNSNVALKNVAVTSGGNDIDAEGGVLRVEGGSGAMAVKATKCSRVILTGAAIGTDATFKDVRSIEIQDGDAGGNLTFTNVASVEMRASKIGGNVRLSGVSSASLQANNAGGSLSFSGDRFDSGGNDFGGGGTIDAGFGALGGDTFGGALSLTGVFLVGEVGASDVTNKGFMLLEGGSGSSLFPLTKRGWHTTGSMEQIVETDLNVNVGSNISVKAGAKIDQTAGGGFSVTAPTIDHN